MPDDSTTDPDAPDDADRPLPIVTAPDAPIVVVPLLNTSDPDPPSDHEYPDDTTTPPLDT